MSKECTGILAQDSDTGLLMHGGNMDQSPESVRNVTMRFSFTRGGETVFQGVDWYWITTGLTRAVRKGFVSVQENWRDAGVQDPWATLQLIAQGRATPQVFVFRKLLSLPSPPTWEQAVERLSNEPLAAPFYVVLGGTKPGEAVVIARNLTAPEDVLTMRETQDKWFVTQSNYDRRSPEGSFLPDNSGDPRRTAADVLMRQHGTRNAVSAVGLFAVVSTYPIHNPDTAYTAVMCAATGELTAYVRQSMCPEFKDEGGVLPDARYCRGKTV